ncbi:MAG: acyl-CoA thioesterase [Bradyrhizobium sp.]|nr:MAG: acyl-CoA thioesterase [Bradyrhizobium sp.]
MRRIVATASLGLWLAGLAATAQAQVVAFGASNVAGRGVSRVEAFPAQLEGILRAQGYAVAVTNAGVSGDGSRQMLARFDAAIPAGTRVVILDIGGGMWNDARLHVDYAVGVADFTTMKAKLRARAIAIVDLDTNRDMPPQFIQPDHIHLTAEGHRLLAERLAPQVIAALNETK